MAPSVSSLPIIARSTAASDRPTLEGLIPVSMGFITPTVRPLRCSPMASAAVTKVFPTPVSVPVIHTPAPRRERLRVFIKRDIGCHSSTPVRTYPLAASGGEPFEPPPRAPAAGEGHDPPMFPWHG